MPPGQTRVEANSNCTAGASLVSCTVPLADCYSREFCRALWFLLTPTWGPSDETLKNLGSGLSSIDSGMVGHGQDGGDQLEPGAAVSQGLEVGRHQLLGEFEASDGMEVWDSAAGYEPERKRNQVCQCFADYAGRFPGHYWGIPQGGAAGTG